MTKQTRRTVFFLLVVLASLFLAGCSGVDDLRVVNHYPFAVSLRHQNGDVIGEVPAQTTRTFKSEGGYNGSQIDGIHIEDAHHKLRLTLNHDSPIVDEQDKGINGASTWNVTLGHRPASLAIPAKPLPLGWIAVGVVLFIGWIEWRAHKKEKSTPLP